MNEAMIVTLDDGRKQVVCSQCGDKLFICNNQREAALRAGQVADHYREKHDIYQTVTANK